MNKIEITNLTEEMIKWNKRLFLLVLLGLISFITISVIWLR